MNHCLQAVSATDSSGALMLQNSMAVFAVSEVIKNNAQVHLAGCVHPFVALWRSAGTAMPGMGDLNGVVNVRTCRPQSMSWAAARSPAAAMTRQH